MPTFEQLKPINGDWVIEEKIDEYISMDCLHTRNDSQAPIV